MNRYRLLGLLAQEGAEVLGFSRFENVAVSFSVFFQTSFLTRLRPAWLRHSCGTLLESNDPVREAARVPISLCPIHPRNPVFPHFQTVQISTRSRWRPHLEMQLKSGITMAAPITRAMQA